MNVTGHMSMTEEEAVRIAGTSDLQPHLLRIVVIVSFPVLRALFSIAREWGRRSSLSGSRARCSLGFNWYFRTSSGFRTYDVEIASAV
jgi:hypothetical protein